MTADATDEALVRRCSRYAFKGLSPGLTREDLMQEGRIALWLAQQGNRVPDEPVHRTRYVRKRVLGAMHDANRRAWRQQPMLVGELFEQADGIAASPDASLRLRQLIAYLSRRGSQRMKECIELLAEGLSCAEVAAQMGVSQGRVSQYRSEARAAAAGYW